MTLYKCPKCNKCTTAGDWNLRTRQISVTEGRYGYDDLTGFPAAFPMIGEPDQNNGRFSCPSCYISEIEGAKVVPVVM